MLSVALLLIFMMSCSESSKSPKLYQNPPVSLLDQVEWVCRHADLTQFMVRERVIYAMAKEDGAQVPLKHIHIVLPDGHYFCSGQTRQNMRFE
ncbi:MAG: hypothetical protein VX399_10735 [SAR324 cluster bacterium]|nr:hypothetical protein [SAR324 cluster bacterium]